MRSKIIEDIDAQLATIKAEGAPRPRLCAACGQAVNILTDSYNLVDGKPRHTTCPTSAALSNLERLDTQNLISTENRSSEAGQAGPVYLTIQEAARLIRVSDKTIRRKIQAGELPAKRLRGGQTVLIEQSDLLALLEDAREAA